MANKKDVWAETFRRALIAKGNEPIGEGWLTIDGFVDQSGLSRKKSYDFLKTEMAAGRIEKFVGNTQRNGRLTTACWYRPRK